MGKIFFQPKQLKNWEKAMKWPQQADFPDSFQGYVFCGSVFFLGGGGGEVNTDTEKKPKQTKT